jgi:predicted  nucleic acid-binding Zn-ribbon protein
MDTKHFEELKIKIESLKSSYARASGAIENITDTLKKEFSVASSGEMKQKITDMKAEVEQEEQQSDAAMKQLEELLKGTEGLC